ncbi:MAG: phosphoglycerate kinase [Planctomycetes bacterium]|nr:phosphoglycerate kinase [Planctomycetota bacterium]NOG52726.1 phosphoglycerate kinase [Planctomycetota bacterium]
MAKLNIEQVDVSGKKVLVRVDFNVPMNAEGAITDDRRIRMSLPTIQHILSNSGSVILMSHLGRPEAVGYEEKFSLAPVAKALEGLLERSVAFPSQDCTDDTAAQAAASLAPGDVMLLDNLRFHQDETGNKPEFAARLASYADVFCNDAFGTAHRAHASMVGVPAAMAGKPCAAGFLMTQEIRYLADALESPDRPFVAILGGSKVSDKLDAITNLLQKVDRLIIGGAMAYTILHTMGREIANSLFEKDQVESAKRIVELAAQCPSDLFLPKDHVCARELSDLSPIRVFDDHIEAGWMGLDIGPKTQGLFDTKIAGARTIVWNGPVGVFELGPFEVGTEVIAKAVARETAAGAISILGGGDTSAAAEKFELTDKYTHISTGGGACLRMLEGKPLPGVDALNDAS